MILSLINFFMGNFIELQLYNFSKSNNGGNMVKNNNRHKIFTSGDDFLNKFLPMIDDEEQRRLQEIQKEEEDWDFLMRKFRKKTKKQNCKSNKFKPSEMNLI